MTQMEVAKRLGVSDAAVCQWEKGDTMPTAGRLVQIARLYGVTVDELLRTEQTA